MERKTIHSTIDQLKELKDKKAVEWLKVLEEEDSVEMIARIQGIAKT